MSVSDLMVQFVIVLLAATAGFSVAQIRWERKGKVPRR